MIAIPLLRLGLLPAALAVLTVGCSSGAGQGGGKTVASAAGSGAASAGSGGVSGTIAAGTGWRHPAVSATSSGAGASGGGAATAPSAGSAPSAPAAATGAVLRGTIPADPATGFGGFLFLVGERLIPGSSVVVSYQGVPLKALPAYFHSAEVIAITVLFSIPGDYGFTALAPDGTTSTCLNLNVPSGGSAGVFTIEPPALHMVYPPSLDTSFAGTIWLMGEHFMPGSTLLVSSGGGLPVAIPLLFVNERSLGWVAATPFAGDMTLRILNPTMLTSAPVTVTVQGGFSSVPAGFPAPGLLLPPRSVASPFLGVLHIYGEHFLPGAVVALRDLATGAATETPVLFISSAEVWWTLAYPAAGSYEVRVRNPDGQETPPWPFSVQ